MENEEVISAYRSPWQNPFVERVIGSIRRDCLDYVIIFNDDQLMRILKSYFEYYHNERTHLGFDKDTSNERPIQPKPSESAKVIKFPGMMVSKIHETIRVGGLHHRYDWKEAAYILNPAHLFILMRTSQYILQALRHKSSEKLPSKPEDRHSCAFKTFPRLNSDTSPLKPQNVRSAF